ncbi:hypothetical protein THAOC_08475 [Thalassiosira oceanica]|uniref:Uncharacterized protein n=1 Tax=Thalassiosira oceanica TaxID=159749 RepID=K0SZ10_THAOC|nr:hypothetical protein THAOC_08475 [Thalassiosira oceanica]|eukprot:EJK70189.1 hypothetical protein THAOC_08475 [Thalassiosira oceanica]
MYASFFSSFSAWESSSMGLHVSAGLKRVASGGSAWCPAVAASRVPPPAVPRPSTGRSRAPKGTDDKDSLTANEQGQARSRGLIRSKAPSTDGTGGPVGDGRGRGGPGDGLRRRLLDGDLIIAPSDPLTDRANPRLLFLPGGALEDPTEGGDGGGRAVRQRLLLGRDDLSDYYIPRQARPKLGAGPATAALASRGAGGGGGDTGRLTGSHSGWPAVSLEGRTYLLGLSDLAPSARIRPPGDQLERLSGSIDRANGQAEGRRNEL